MSLPDLSRRIEDLKRASASARRARRRGPPALPAVLARLERVEAAAAGVASVLEELAAALGGLTLVRSLGNGSRVIAVCGSEPPCRQGRRTRAAWTRLEVRLRSDGRGDALRVACRATACDHDLPTLRTEVPLEGGVERCREFVEACALAFARELIARRRAPAARPVARRAPAVA